MADNTVTVVGNVTRDPELRFTPSRPGGRHLRPRRQPPLAEPPDPGVGGAGRRSSTSPAGPSWPRTSASRSSRAPASSSPAASSSARGRPTRATSARRSRSSPTRSAPACAGPPPRSPRTSAASPAERRRRRRWRRRSAASRPVANEAARGGYDRERGALLMARSRSAARTRTTPAAPRRRSASCSQERVEYVDYKDVNLLRRFMSDRAKIRARRVTGNDAQQQAEIARAIKNAREMALLPYASRVTQHAWPERDGERGGRERDRDLPAPDDRAAASDRAAPDAGDEPTSTRSTTRSAPTSSCAGDVGGAEDEADEGRPPLRRRRRRQEGRHRRRRRRLRPQLPRARRAWPFQATAGRRGAGRGDAPQPRRAGRQRPRRGRGGRHRPRARTVVTITARAGAEGKLFGSVTTADIVDAVAGADRHRARPPPAPPRRADQGRRAPTWCRSSSTPTSSSRSPSRSSAADPGRPRRPAPRIDVVTAHAVPQRVLVERRHVVPRLSPGLCVLVAHKPASRQGEPAHGDATNRR